MTDIEFLDKAIRAYGHSKIKLSVVTEKEHGNDIGDIRLDIGVTYIYHALPAVVQAMKETYAEMWLNYIIKENSK